MTRAEAIADRRAGLALVVGGCLLTWLAPVQWVAVSGWAFGVLGLPLFAPAQLELGPPVWMRPLARRIPGVRSLLWRWEQRHLVRSVRRAERFAALADAHRQMTDGLAQVVREMESK